MALICAISNEVPDHPVVSPSSGAIFEKRIIEKYINENGVDPISGKEISLEELIEIKTPPIIKPKPPSATSIPATLKLLQDEWDAVMLYSFTQRQQLQTARQELSHALYQHDAACRVIARLNKEVTAAREALATLKPQAGMTSVPQPAVAAEPSGIAAQPIEQAGMSAEVIQKLQDKATVLTQERKKRGRTVPEELVTPDQIRSFRTMASQIGLHSASIPGILALDVHSTDTSKVLTGGNDKNATVFNKDTEQVVAILKGHTKKVTKVIYHSNEDIVLTASPDSTIRVWHVPTAQTTLFLRCHDAPVTGLSLHPTGDYVLSTSEDQHWAFSDINTGRLLTKVSDISNIPLTTAQLHPDGLIFGTGTADSQVKIWDLKEQSNVANFTGHSGAITTISFSENGYYLATAADDACVKLWDLRKLKNFKTLQLDEGYQIRDLCFDQSGTYLAVAGTDVRIKTCVGCEEKEIVSENSLEAIREIVVNLREIVINMRNVRVLGNGWLFRGDATANQAITNEILAHIQNGNSHDTITNKICSGAGFADVIACPNLKILGSQRSVRNMLEAGWRVEASQALYKFLTRLNQPLIPASIQSLVLDNNNVNVTPETVASDVLGLISEELHPRHRELIALILDLLDCSIKSAPSDEIRGHTLPISMLPMFFNIGDYHFMHEWKRILAIFIELIRQGPETLYAPIT